MIKHIKCDIFESGAEVICHQVNCQGVMGGGVAKQVREKYPEVYEEYKKWCDQYGEYCLGLVQSGHIGNGRVICNLFAQNNFGYDGNCYTNYDALRECLNKVKTYHSNKTIAIPYLMACHRGGGDWNVVSKMIEEILGDCDVLICEYNGG